MIAAGALQSGSKAPFLDMVARLCYVTLKPCPDSRRQGCGFAVFGGEMRFTNNPPPGRNESLRNYYERLALAQMDWPLRGTIEWTACMINAEIAEYCHKHADGKANAD